jgi:hypothetical protein
MTRQEIDDMVCEIMVNDGPDRHVDGHEVITDFIVSLLTGMDRAWEEAYAKKVAEDDRRRQEWLKNWR